MAKPVLTPTSGYPGLTLEDHVALATAPRLRPEQQFWNFPAKKAAGERIAEEEKHKFGTHHNDVEDATRHAEWSQRMATDIGPIFSGLAGGYHEALNLMGAVGSAPYRVAYGPYNDPEHHPSILQTLSETGMDLRNNAEGIAAAVSGRPIDPNRLQTRPVIPGYR